MAGAHNPERAENPHFPRIPEPPFQHSIIEEERGWRTLMGARPTFEKSLDTFNLTPSEPIVAFPSEGTKPSRTCPS